MIADWLAAAPDIACTVIFAGMTLYGLKTVVPLLERILAVQEERAARERDTSVS